MTSWPAVDCNDPKWLALRAEIEQTVALQESKIRLGEREFVWYRVANPELLLDAAVAASPEEAAEDLDPFWSVPWRAAQGLDRFLGRVNLVGQRVLELGCGSGQAGTGAAARGGLVTLTDAVSLALKVAQLNSWPVAQRVEFLKLKWNDTTWLEPFPIIIGSDLVYDPSLFVALEACARRYLAAGGRLYLSEPQRHTGDRFLNWIRQAGWECSVHLVDLDDARVMIRVFECTLPCISLAAIRERP